MGKIIIHSQPDFESIEDRRLSEILQLSPNQRMKRAFDLMSVSKMFSQNKIIKSPQRLGVVLKK